MICNVSNAGGIVEFFILVLVVLVVSVFVLTIVLTYKIGSRKQASGLGESISRIRLTQGSTSKAELLCSIFCAILMLNCCDAVYQTCSVPFPVKDGYSERIET